MNKLQYIIFSILFFSLSIDILGMEEIPSGMTPVVTQNKQNVGQSNNEKRKRRRSRKNSKRRGSQKKGNILSPQQPNSAPSSPHKKFNDQEEQNGYSSESGLDVEVNPVVPNDYQIIGNPSEYKDEDDGFKTPTGELPLSFGVNNNSEVSEHSESEEGPGCIDEEENKVLPIKNNYCRDSGDFSSSGEGSGAWSEDTKTIIVHTTKTKENGSDTDTDEANLSGEEDVFACDKDEVCYGNSRSDEERFINKTQFEEPDKSFSDSELHDWRRAIAAGMVKEVTSGEFSDVRSKYENEDEEEQDIDEASKSHSEESSDSENDNELGDNNPEISDSNGLEEEAENEGQGIDQEAVGEEKQDENKKAPEPLKRGYDQNDSEQDDETTTDRETDESGSEEDSTITKVTSKKSVIKKSILAVTGISVIGCLVYKLVENFCSKKSETVEEEILD